MLDFTEEDYYSVLPCVTVWLASCSYETPSLAILDYAISVDLCDGIQQANALLAIAEQMEKDEAKDSLRYVPNN